MRTVGTQQPPTAQAGFYLDRHPMRRVVVASGRVPQMVGDEFQEQRIRGRPGNVTSPTSSIIRITPQTAVGILEMRHIGRLEMRQSSLVTVNADRKDDDVKRG
jgi:hypothetical protein